MAEYDILCKIHHGNGQSIAVCEDVVGKVHHSFMLIGENAREGIEH